MTKDVILENEAHTYVYLVGKWHFTIGNIRNATNELNMSLIEFSGTVMESAGQLWWSFG